MSYHKSLGGKVIRKCRWLESLPFTWSEEKDNRSDLFDVSWVIYYVSQICETWFLSCKHVWSLRQRFWVSFGRARVTQPHHLNFQKVKQIEEVKLIVDIGCFLKQSIFFFPFPFQDNFPGKFII